MSNSAMQGEPAELPDAARALVGAIGQTPLVEIPFAAEVAPGVRLFAKLESLNPSGSIKDRPVARMLVEAWRAGVFADGRHLLDSSSGNAGIAYAMLGAALGIGVTIVVPGNASRERLERMRAYGAELVVTDPIEGYDFALREAHTLAEREPERYWHCDQYANADNWRSHFVGTAEEILTQLHERGLPAPDTLVAGIGTGGTLTGCGRRLCLANPNIHIAVAIPETFPGIEGLKPFGAPGDIVPALLDATLINERIGVSSEQAVAMCRRLATLGLFVGPSSGAFVHAALRVAASGHYRCIVTFLNDTGERYVSTGMWGADT
ncbi:PLP-dependent cysteine synthase family protein [Crenobacter sp. SG2305]|uniref:PLP-dependent cysteine synthase family protein n=1 Tax=Crenobacter oryzisoli TaxID=3056844 RepID=UPI0025AA3921|nr:PLP-dependent cysteine synthase family protein [Crenobacter sp. SG2305]MDN0083577.1 PLP-dependent cysteine synthase family protein [Crenobacter sp. SG2305]